MFDFLKAALYGASTWFGMATSVITFSYAWNGVQDVTGQYHGTLLLADLYQRFFIWGAIASICFTIRKLVQ